jgi:TRAP-type C4-dicarboxylate transport system permease small subunit
VATLNNEIRGDSMIQALYKGMIKAIELLLVVGITFIALFTAYEVCMRELFAKPTIWTNEITSYLLVWVGLLGVVYAYDKGAHVSVDLIFRRLSVRIQRLSNIITGVLIFFFALCIGFCGYQYWWLGYSRGWRHYGMLDVPMSYTRIALPITGLLLAFQLTITIYSGIRALKSEGEKEGTLGESG